MNNQEAGEWLKTGEGNKQSGDTGGRGVAEDRQDNDYKIKQDTNKLIS